jgi:hypothetical protein
MSEQVLEQIKRGEFYVVVNGIPIEDDVSRYSSAKDFTAVRIRSGRHNFSD